jgi:hypothetical protein
MGHNTTRQALLMRWAQLCAEPFFLAAGALEAWVVSPDRRGPVFRRQRPDRTQPLCGDLASAFALTCPNA